MLLVNMNRKKEAKKSKRITLKKHVVGEYESKRCAAVTERVSDSDSSDEDNILHSAIRTRTSPKPLFSAIHSMSKIQRKCLKHMGFGKLQKFNINRIPRKLGYYVVDQFNDHDLEIKLEEESVKVTKERIHEMIGVPIGGVQLRSLDGGKVKDTIWVEWMKQYNKKEISPAEIQRKIVQSDLADWNFKLNFLMLFTNIMGGCKSRGTCNLGISKYIRQDTIIENIDWCAYLCECMQLCKIGWKRDDARNFFAGPITLLTLIYVDATSCDSMDMVRRRPAIRSLSYDSLKKRENLEIADGGFGFGDLEPVYEISTTEVEDVSDEEQPPPVHSYGSRAIDEKVCENLMS